MKILMVHNCYLLPGGEDEVVRAEKKMLESFGHQVVMYERSNEELKRLSILDKLSYSLKDIYWSHQSYSKIRKLIKEHRPQVSHIHNTFYAISPSVYQACNDERVPVVQTLHNYRFLCPIATFYRDGRVCEDCLTQGRKAAVKNRCWNRSYILSAILKNIVDEFYKREIVPTRTKD